MSITAMYAIIGFVLGIVLILSCRLFQVMVFSPEYMEKNDFGDWSLSRYETGEFRGGGKHCK